jgi:hypothetical protein
MILKCSNQIAKLAIIVYRIHLCKLNLLNLVRFSLYKYVAKRIRLECHKEDDRGAPFQDLHVSIPTETFLEDLLQTTYLLYPSVHTPPHLLYKIECCRNTYI